MRKYINIPVLCLGLLVFGLIGCADDLEVSSPISPAGYSTATITSDFTGGTIKEGDTLTFNISIDKQMDTDIPFTGQVNLGTLTTDDFEFIGGVIAAYTSETTLLAVLTRDYLVEGDEIGQLEIGSLDVGNRYRLNEATENLVLDLTAENYISPALDMYFEWEGDVTIATVDDRLGENTWTEHLSDWVDFDIFIADAEGYDFSDPWATFNPATYAATGSNPEHIVVDPTILPEGSYYLFCALWANEFSNFDTLYNVTHIDMPITTHVMRQGSFETYVAQDESQVINSVTAGEDDVLFAGDWESIYTTLFKLTITADEYIIEDIDDNEIARGRINTNPSTRPAFLMK